MSAHARPCFSNYVANPACSLAREMNVGICAGSSNRREDGFREEMYGFGRQYTRHASPELVRVHL